jgi:hypothetical protein
MTVRQLLKRTSDAEILGWSWIVDRDGYLRNRCVLKSTVKILRTLVDADLCGVRVFLKPTCRTEAAEPYRIRYGDEHPAISADMFYCIVMEYAATEDGSGERQYWYVLNTLPRT